MKAIVAMDPHRVIGNEGKIPWHYPEDFKFFKEITMGHSLVMGRSTYESIGKPLPGRFTYILTKDEKKQALPWGTLCGYVSEDWLCALQIQLFTLSILPAWKPSKDIWVCGGASVYDLLLPVCDEVYVTHIMDTYDGDTFMPEFESQFPNSTILKQTDDFWIVKYGK